MYIYIEKRTKELYLIIKKGYRKSYTPNDLSPLWYNFKIDLSQQGWNQKEVGHRGKKNKRMIIEKDAKWSNQYQTTPITLDGNNSSTQLTTSLDGIND